MTELERVASAILSQWHSEGGDDAEPIAVSALLDRILPYRVARRVLGIDISEDYEALMLRLLAEEEELVVVLPSGAAELARTTIASQLPDLGVLQLLRSATITVTERTITAAATATSASPPAAEPAAAPPPVPAIVEPAPKPPAAAESPVASERETCWSCAEELPTGHTVKFCPFCGADQRQPSCAACGAAAERGWKHCAECGAKL